MKQLLLLLCTTLLFFPASKAQSTPAQPTTRQDNVQEIMHGVTVTDPYRWLEDQASPETRTWINAQNAYTHALLDSYPGRARLEQRATELLKVGSIRFPIERSGRYFFRKRTADQDLYLIYMRKGTEANDELLIDPLPLSPDHSTNVDLMDVSRDGKVLAYLVRVGGADEDEIRFFDVEAHRDLPDHLPAAVHFELSFLPDRSGCYYSLMTGEGPRVRFHSFGTDPSQDTEVFGKGYGKEIILVGDVSEDGKHLVIHALHGSSGDRVEIWIRDLQRKDSQFESLTTGLDARFFAFSAGDQLFLHTNWKAPHGRVLAVSFADPAREHWREVVPESDAAIDAVTVAGGKVLVTYVRNAASQLKIFSPDGREASEIPFPTLGAIEGIGGRWEGDEAYVEFSSFATPRTIYRYQLSTGKQSVWAQLTAPVDGSKFEVHQEWFQSKDGTRVPMFLLHAKGLKLDGSNPLLLTGYGGFTVNLTPEFSPEAILFAEKGGVFAQVNLRGGGEFGEPWHRAGMMENKQTVFDDFIAAGEWLVKNRYTEPSRLSIVGGSNGGLLVGAALTQRPDLFRAVVCWHPLLDMLRYQKFMEAQFWVSEYGSAENQDQFKYLYAYSPYHHVQAGTKYPAVLLMTGDADTRVAPLHARKMTARLQAANASDHPILLRYELKAGHSAGRSVTAQIGDLTDEMTFLCWQLGIR